MSKVLALIDRIGGVAAALAALGVIVLTLLIFAGVVARYGLGSAIPWIDEAVRYVLLFTVMLGVADVMRRGENIQVDLFSEALPDRGKRIIEIAGLVTAAVFAAALVWLGADMVKFSREMGLTTAGKIDIPSAWVEIALPFGGFLLLLATLARLIRVLRREPVLRPGGHLPSGSDRE
jgi:C4-dicarboxylate transporter, DctQ subunit